MRACAIIPAYDAEATIAAVVSGVRALWPTQDAVFVVDDGSRDGTAKAARAAGARLVILPTNLGKGAALRAGMAAAQDAGFDVAVTLDADGQHPADEALRLALFPCDPAALVLGIRDLPAVGAPRASQISNRISNFFLSLFSGRRLADTQCGLRRYPLPLALDLAGRDNGYAFEAEIILRAIAAGVRLVEEPVEVYYPPEQERVTHFDSVKDPARIVRRVVATLVATRGMRRAASPVPAPTGARGSALDPAAVPASNEARPRDASLRDAPGISP
jgi:glycosyltransferase involved in cell wall biosynthesis